MDEQRVMTFGQNLPMNASGSYAPWGEQGIELKDAPTSAEAMRQAGLNWRVEKRPVLYHASAVTLRKQSDVLKYDDKKVVVRTDTDHPLSVVGNKWTPLQNAEAFRFFDPFVEQGYCEYSTAGYINNGERVWIMAKILADSMEVVKGDPVDSYILLTNMHSAIACGRALFTNIRFVCTNMLPSLMRVAKHQKIFHVGDMIKNLADVQEIINIRRGDFDTTLQQYRRLAKVNVNDAKFKEYLNAVLANPKTKTVNGTLIKEKDEGSHRNTFNRITELFETGQGTKIKGVRGTYWGAYNAVTEYFGYHQGRKLDNRLTSIFYGEGRKKSQKALEVAVSMAA